jgi:poly(A) polymerase Pap1
MATDPRLGVTVTMSNDAPTQLDLKLDDTLLQELKSRNEFEAQEETGRRYVAS